MYSPGSCRSVTQNRPQAERTPRSSASMVGTTNSVVNLETSANAKKTTIASAKNRQIVDSGTVSIESRGQNVRYAGTPTAARLRTPRAVRNPNNLSPLPKFSLSPDSIETEPERNES